VIVTKELAEDDLQCRTPKMRQWSSSSRRTCTDPALGEGVRSRSPERKPDDSHGVVPEDLVEGSSELGIAVTKEGLGRELAVLEPPGQLPRLLNDPTASRRGGAAGQVL